MPVELQDIARRLASLERLQGGVAVVRRPQAYERPPAEPSVSNLQVHSQTPSSSGTGMILTWIDSDDRRVGEYEVWAREDGDTEPRLITSVQRSPAAFNYAVPEDTPTQFLVRPVYSDGGGASLDRAVSTAAAVHAQVAGDIQVTSPDQIDPGVVQDQHFDRVSANAIQITTADIVDAAITNAKIQNATITAAKIVSLEATQIAAGTLQAGVVLASQIAASQINAGTLAAGVILASNIAASQISAGMLAAGVILASNIAASQINAGTLASVNISAGTYSLTSGSNQMTINGSTGFRQFNSSTLGEVRIISGGVDGYSNSQHGFSLSAQLAGAVRGGYLQLTSSGSPRALAGVNSSNIGEVLLYNSGGSNQVRLDASGGLYLGGTQTIDLSRQAALTRLTLTGQWRTNQNIASGNPALTATAKIPVYTTNGTLINYLYLYP